MSAEVHIWFLKKKQLDELMAKASGNPSNNMRLVADFGISPEEDIKDENMLYMKLWTALAFLERLAIIYGDIRTDSYEVIKKIISPFMYSFEEVTCCDKKYVSKFRYSGSEAPITVLPFDEVSKLQLQIQFIEFSELEDAYGSKFDNGGVPIEHDWVDGSSDDNSDYWKDVLPLNTSKQFVGYLKYICSIYKEAVETECAIATILNS